MKILLTADVSKLGKAGDLVDVSDGYAKNYIIPRKLGKEATKQVQHEWEQKKSREAYLKQKEREQAIETAKNLGSKVVVLKQKAGQDGRLFGSVTAKEIAEALKEQHSIEVDRKKILLKDPIKAVGGYTVEVRLMADAVGKLSVMIEPQD